MRLITLALAALLLLVQIPLWLGKGGWFRVWELGRQVEQQNLTNAQLRTRNASLEAEVRDLKSGTGAIEERARYELGMVKEGEVFIRIVDQAKDSAGHGGPTEGSAYARAPAGGTGSPGAGGPSATAVPPDAAGRASAGRPPGAGAEAPRTNPVASR